MDAVVVGHDTRDLLRACLESVYRERPSRVVVVETGSSDGSAAMVRAEFGSAVLVSDIGNPGYGTAANLGISASTSPYVLLLNADTVLHPGAVSALARCLDRHPRAAVVGPRIQDPAGELQRSTFPFPGPRTAFLGETRLGALARFIPGLREVYLRTWPHDRPREVPWVLGAALALRREAFDAVGGFDAGYFLYFEETDLCRRLRDAGWEVRFTPDATVTHVGGASTGQRGVDARLHYYAGMEGYYRRHRSRPALALMRLIVRLTRAVAWTLDSARLTWVRDPDTRRRLADSVRASKAIALRSIRAPARGLSEDGPEWS